MVCKHGDRYIHALRVVDRRGPVGVDVQRGSGVGAELPAADHSADRDRAAFRVARVGAVIHARHHRDQLLHGQDPAVLDGGYRRRGRRGGCGLGGDHGLPGTAAALYGRGSVHRGCRGRRIVHRGRSGRGRRHGGRLRGFDRGLRLGGNRHVFIGVPGIGIPVQPGQEDNHHCDHQQENQQHQQCGSSVVFHRGTLRFQDEVRGL